MAAKKKSNKKYGKKSRKIVKKVMHEKKRGTLASGRSKKTVKSRAQAIAIALSEARASGAKVPPPKKRAGKKGATRKKPSRKKTSRKTSSK